MTTRPYEGPYGIIETERLVPRWQHKIQHGMVREVESWTIGALPNIVSEAPLVNDIHAIHQNQVTDYDDADQIDLDAEATAQQKTNSRLLIKPKLKKIRNRSRKDDFSPENVFDVTAETLDTTVQHIETSAREMRDLLLDNVVSTMLGYDIAAGEAEAISRDCLETQVEIDDELVPYLERIGLGNILGKMLANSTHIPEAVRNEVLKDLMNKWMEDVRQEFKNKNKSNLLRRLRHEYSDLVAQSPQQAPSIGTTRGFSELRKREANGQT